jgi:hypothetical protein
LTADDSKLSHNQEEKNALKEIMIDKNPDFYYDKVLREPQIDNKKYVVGLGVFCLILLLIIIYRKITS